MFTQTKWIDRKFEFNYPVGVFPCLLTRLRGTPDRLEAIAARLDPGFLTRPVDLGWTIQENVGHLTDVEALFIGRLEDFRQGLGTLRPAEHDDFHITRIYELIEKFKG